MNGFRWAAAGCTIGVVLGLLSFAPAAWLAAAVAAATEERVQLAQTRGTVWQGSARLVVSAGVGSREAQALPGRIEWEIDPLVHGVQLLVRADCCTALPLQFTLLPAWRGWELRLAKGASQWPAALLAGLGAPWNTVQAQGVLRLQSEGLSVEWAEGRTRLTGSAQLDALGMSSSLSALKPVGSYRLRLTAAADSGTPTVQLQTLEGSLSLSGQGEWNGSRWRFRGEASAAPQNEPALGNLLNMVGRRQGARSLLSLG